jgi:hypothetical protein
MAWALLMKVEQLIVPCKCSSSVITVLCRSHSNKETLYLGLQLFPTLCSFDLSGLCVNVILYESFYIIFNEAKLRGLAEALNYVI